MSIAALAASCCRSPRSLATRFRRSTLACPECRPCLPTRTSTASPSRARRWSCSATPSCAGTCTLSSPRYAAPTVAHAHAHTHTHTHTRAGDMHASLVTFVSCVAVVGRHLRLAYDCRLASWCTDRRLLVESGPHGPQRIQGGCSPNHRDAACHQSRVCRCCSSVTTWHTHSLALSLSLSLTESLRSKAFSW